MDNYFEFMRDIGEVCVKHGYSIVVEPEILEYVVLNINDETMGKMYDYAKQVFSPDKFDEFSIRFRRIDG